MATIAATLTQKLRSSYRGRLDANENRPSEYGALDLFNKQSRGLDSILDPELKKNIENSFGNVVQAPVIDFEAITIGNVRTCEVQVGGAGSKMITLTFFTLSFGFPMVPSRFLNNDLTYENLFIRQLNNRINAALSVLDSKCVDFLELNKNQYFPAPMLQYYPEIADAFQVPADPPVNGLAQHRRWYNRIEAILDTMDFTGTPDILTNPLGMAEVRELRSQGTFNAENQAWLIDGLGMFYKSNRVLNNAGVEVTEYAVLPGAVAMDGRLDPDCRQGRLIGSPENPSKEWTRATLPRIGEMGLYYRADCADESAREVAENNFGLTRAYVESFEWSKDFCIFGNYNSDLAGRYQPITKAELLPA